MRTDDRFREQLARLDEDVKAQRESRFARLRGVTRDDVPIEAIAQFLGVNEIVDNTAGLLKRLLGEDVNDVTVLDSLGAPLLAA